jgi:hypothetical protein
VKYLPHFCFHFAQIFKTEGYPGFYKGLGAQLLKAVLSAALMLAIKEKAFQFALSLMALVRRPPRLTVYKDAVARSINAFDK